MDLVSGEYSSYWLAEAKSSGHAGTLFKLLMLMFYSMAYAKLASLQKSCTL